MDSFDCFQSMFGVRGIFRDILGKISRYVSHRKMQLVDSTGPHATGLDAEGVRIPPSPPPEFNKKSRPFRPAFLFPSSCYFNGSAVSLTIS
ncbi:MAG: hypothetical protein WC023_15355, partial [Rhodocyclaceae bacterium]